MDWEAIDRADRRRRMKDRARWAGELTANALSGMMSFAVLGFCGAVGAGIGWQLGHEIVWAPLYVTTDDVTGCQYLARGAGGVMVPRLDRQGHMVCGVMRSHGDISEAAP